MKKKILKNKLLLRLTIVIAILVVGYFVLRTIDFNGAFTILKQTPLQYILAFLLLSVLIQVFKAITYSFLLKAVKVDLPLHRVLKVFIASQTTSFLPGGETARVILTESEIKNKNEKIASAVLSQIFVELVSAILVALLGSLYFKAFRGPALVSLVILITMLLLILSESVWVRFTKLFSVIRYLKKSAQTFTKVQKLIRSQVFLPDTITISPTFLKVMLFAFIPHLVGGLFIYAISTAYGLNLTILSSVFIFSASIVIQGLLSITPGGVGFTEGGVIGLLVFFGNSFTKALALTITFRVTGFLFNIFVGLIVYLIYYRPGLKKSVERGVNG